MSEGNEIVHVGNSLPSYLKGLEDDSLKDVRKYRVVPLVGFAQKSHPSEFVEKFGVGSAVAYRLNAVIARAGEQVLMHPIFFFTEFVHYSDRNDKQAEKKVLDRTFDDQSDIAKFARNKDLRKKPYERGDKTFYEKFVEHLTFFVVIESGEFKGQLATITFASGEFNTGQNFLNELAMRGAPLWATRWNFRSEIKKHWEENYDWWGWDIAFAGFIEEEEVPQFNKMYEETKKGFAERSMGTEYGDAPDLEEQPAATEKETDGL
jgi:hypothetical protein